MNTNIKGIIFDLDGVIVFTDELHYQAWNRIAAELNIYFDRNINNLLRGVSRMESLEIILRNYKGETLTQNQKVYLTEKKNAIYRELLEDMNASCVSEEVRSTLQILRQRGYRIAVGSSSKNAKLILEKIGLLDIFDGISDGNNIKKSKPDPEVFLKAAEFIGLESRHCLVVEDAKAGIDAAVAAGMYTAAMGSASSTKADYFLKKFSDLLDI